VVVFAVVSVVVVVVSVVVVCVSVVLDVIGVSTTGAGAGVSTITGDGAGAGVSAITGVGAGAGVITVVSVVVVLAVVSTVAGDCVTVTLELLVFFGIRLTLVFVPIAEPLPAPPAELLVYARPLLSTAAGPEITAGVVDVPTSAVFTGACTVATGAPLASAVAGASVRICPYP